MRFRLVALSTSLFVCTLSATANAEEAPVEEAPVGEPPQPATTPPSSPEQRAQPVSTESEKPASDHRFEGAARVGAMLPGEISPVNWFRTEASLAPTLAFDPSFVLHPNFTIGAYLQLTPFSFDRMSGSNVIGEGSGFWASGGLTAKGRIALGDSAIIRAGLTLGRNAVSYSGTMNEGGSEFSLSGGGFSAGPIADAVWRVSPRVGISSQIGFLSQFVGSAQVKGFPTRLTAEGEDRDFGFKPIFFITVGPELSL